MISPQWTAWLLQQFTQSCSGYAVVDFSADAQIGPLFALVLTELACEPNRSVQSEVLHMLIDDDKIL
jgi:hypothetical protein